MKQTAVEWLVEQLKEQKFISESQIHIAKLMEKQEKDEFAIGFAEWIRNKGVIIHTSKEELLEIYKKEKGL